MTHKLNSSNNTYYANKTKKGTPSKYTPSICSIQSNCTAPPFNLSQIKEEVLHQHDSFQDNYSSINPISSEAVNHYMFFANSATPSASLRSAASVIFSSSSSVTSLQQETDSIYSVYENSNVVCFWCEKEISRKVKTVMQSDFCLKEPGYYSQTARTTTKKSNKARELNNQTPSLYCSTINSTSSKFSSALRFGSSKIKSYWKKITMYKHWNDKLHENGNSTRVKCYGLNYATSKESIESSCNCSFYSRNESQGTWRLGLDFPFGKSVSDMEQLQRLNTTKETFSRNNSSSNLSNFVVNDGIF